MKQPKHSILYIDETDSYSLIKRGKMREWQFGKASSIAMGDALSYSKKRNGAEGFDWLFEGETIGIMDGVPRSAGMRKLELTNDYPYPDAEIGTKEELFNSLLKGECILSPCVEPKFWACK